ncbi:peroxiredoxin family protein [Pedobacter borealis]|uniref:peroxiredoxin family protein n=1 Tax=Pedobacter borealis TaxID=475254 RepID=UPI0014289A5C|nr:TlpA disulfide reductase family protein [Pedobacter borealis]
MKKNNFIILLFLALCFGMARNLKAQDVTETQATENTKKFKEKLKGLVALDPFKVTQEQGKSFDLTKSTEIYRQDGSIVMSGQVAEYSAQINYILIPYVNPADKNKIVLMVVRDATPEEKEAQRLLRQKAGMYVMDGIDPNGLDLSKPGTYEAIKFDANLNKDEFIKGLHQMPILKFGGRQMNSGRVAFFDEKGKLIPMLLADGSQNPVFAKYMGDVNFQHVDYCDDNGLIKAAIYRKSTLEEKRGRGQTMTVMTPIDASIVGGGGSSTNSSAQLKIIDPGNTKGVTAVGSKLEDFSAKDINGTDISLSQYKGKKVVVLNFWFTKCAPCLEEMPKLNKLVDEYQGKDVEFISFCNDDANTINEFLKTHEFKYRILPSSLKLANKYKVAAFPTNIVVDKNGKVSFYEVMYSENIDSSLKKAIDSGL